MEWLPDHRRLTSGRCDNSRGLLSKRFTIALEVLSNLARRPGVCAMCNGGGHRLVDVLASCGPMPQARYVWSFGTDGGVFDGVRVEAYGKDFPIDRLEEDVLLAVAMNGETLRPENGFPVRLVV